MHHTSSPQSGVIVTGGASGIGMACAEALAATGRPVAVWDLHEEAAQRVARDIGQRFDVATTGIGIDLCTTDAIDAAVRATRAALAVPAKHRPCARRRRSRRRFVRAWRHGRRAR